MVHIATLRYLRYYQWYKSHPFSSQELLKSPPPPTPRGGITLFWDQININVTLTLKHIKSNIRYIYCNPSFLLYIFKKVANSRRGRIWGFRNLCHLPGALPVHNMTDLSVHIVISCYIVLTCSLRVLNRLVENKWNTVVLNRHKTHQYEKNCLFLFVCIRLINTILWHV